MLTIRTLKKDEFIQLTNAIILENWYLESVHLESLYVEFQDDFFIAFKDNKTIGFISALKYENNFGFISNFIVLREFRSLGFGQELFSHALVHLQGRQIALECELDKNKLYINNGFKSYYDCVYYVYKIDRESENDKNIVTTMNESDFLNFNQKTVHKKYAKHLYTVAKDKNTIYRAVYKDKEISSYGLCTKYTDGYKISISSNTKEEALAIFSSLIQEFSLSTKIYIEVSKLEPILINIVELLNMKEFSRKMRMYNKVLD